MGERWSTITLKSLEDVADLPISRGYISSDSDEPQERTNYGTRLHYVLTYVRRGVEEASPPHQWRVKYTLH